MLDTRKVADRRNLRYASIDDLLADIDRIVAAENAGTLSHTGNWTAGQAMGHVAAWINYGYDGYPIKPPPFPISIILRFMGKRMLTKGMRPGVRIPGVPNGTLATEPLSTQDGAAQLRAALQRLKKGEPARFPSPAFGPMTEADRVQLNLRHAELHLSFLKL